MYVIREYIHKYIRFKTVQEFTKNAPTTAPGFNVHSITFQIPECLGYTAECTKRPPKNAPLLIIFVISAGGPACGRRVLTLPPCSCAGAGLPAAPPLLAAAPLMCRPPQPPRAQPPQLTSSSAPAPAARGIRPARHPTSPSCAATTLLSNDGT
jgi:hypothetical protein